jgi:predicted nucleotidyltransferase
MRTLPITIHPDEIAALCRRHGIAELSFFGSILREDFGPNSDIDVLIAFQPGKTLTLNSYTDIREELSTLFGGREVDLVETRRLADPYRRHEILRTREQVYAN